jgi:hypothetical protein
VSTPSSQLDIPVILPVSSSSTGEVPEVPDPVPSPEVPVLVQTETGKNPDNLNDQDLEEGCGEKPKIARSAPKAKRTRQQHSAAPPPLAVPSELADFHAEFEGCQGYNPSAGFFKRVLADYDPTWAHGEAVGAADWYRQHPDKNKNGCSTAYILNWLRRARERQGVESRTIHERQVHSVPKPTRYKPTKQEYSIAQAILEERLDHDVPDSEIAPDILAEMNDLLARGYRPGIDPYVGWER